GPQLVAHAITPANPLLEISFRDNTDPDGIGRVMEQIGSELATTITLVVSKSGGTKETRNGMLEAEAAYKAAGLDFAKHAVAVTGAGSELDKHSSAQGWLTRFPMWDWVGGRTSVMSAVGTIAAALQGVDVRQFLAGAAAMDAETRSRPARENAAMLLALMWHHTGKGKGLKDMVVLPYKDRLALFSKYLQQLVMESLGKEHDLSGAVVNQGIAVYGNKGSTDQHAYVQQLRDGVNNFFATFIEVGKARDTASLEVDPGFTSGDYLQGFLRGTRKALAEKGRESITLSITDINAFSLGMLIALFERAVGFYASLVNINAYHQPGVEAGKKAATEFLNQLAKVRAVLSASALTADEVAARLGIDAEDAFHMLNHLAANGQGRVLSLGAGPAQDQFAAS
ncbi:MAG TPA: glucose-6-phosphate isomerase, partial [Prosthecobacter sp.]|nr:glucose-6-phosphate isomerase [Prosthecobacter sp.]